MRNFRTPLMRSLQKAMHIAHLSEQPDAPTADELTDMLHEGVTPAAYSRRDFLKESVAASMAFGISTVLPSGLMPDFLGQKTKIAIVGGGIAGLNTAYQLKKRGVSATIYESSKRVGGRMFTEKLFGNAQTTELGGEFIDSNHADILALAKELGIIRLDKKADKSIGDTYFFEDKLFSEKAVIKQFSRVRAKIGRDAVSLGKEFDTPNAKKFDNMTMFDYIQGLDLDDWMKKLLDTAYVGEFGLTTAEQPAFTFLNMVGDQRPSKGFDIFGVSDERYKFLGGNQQICDKISTKLGANQVKTEHRLVAVKSKNKGFTLTFDTNGSPLDVEADIVVMTIPFSVLRNVSLNIDMSPEKRASIDQLDYGTNGKIFLDINERVWRKQNYQGYLYSPAINTGWDSYHLQNGNKGKSAYTIFLGAAAGAAVTKEGDFYKPYLAELDKAFTGAAQQFNNKVEAFNWTNYPHARGSYAAYKVGQWTTIAGKEIEPVGNMLFAGEHCSTDFQGYMNGGAETGRKAAAAILKKMGIALHKSPPHH